jgi:hypothetical protein
MGVSGFGPAPRINVDEFERCFREGVQGTSPNNAPSKLPRLTQSSRLPHSALSRRAPKTLDRARIGEPLDVRSSPQSHLTHVDETSIVNAEDQRALDVDDFRRWWRQRSPQEAAQDRSRGRKLTRIAIALAGTALISSALVLKGGAPTLLKRPPAADLANDSAKAQNPRGDIAGTPADISTTLPGLSGDTPAAPEVDAQTVEGLAAQTTEPDPAPRVSARPEGTLIASQVSSTSERWSAADAPNPLRIPTKPATHSNRKPATDSDLKPAGVPI